VYWRVTGPEVGDTNNAMSPSSASASATAASVREESSLLIPFAFGHLAIDWGFCALWLIVPAAGVVMGLSPAEIGLLFAINNFGSALALAPSGVLADRVSNRGRLLLLTFWWVTVGYLVASFATGFWALALLLALAGLGDAAWHPIATGVLAEQEPSRRAHALGVHAVGGALAAVLAPLAVGFALAYMDWRWAMRLSIIPTVVMGLVFFFFVSRVPRSAQGSISRADFRVLWQSWRRPAGLALILMMVLYNMANVALMAMTPLLLQTVHGLDTAATGMAFSGMLLGGALLQPSVGRFSDRAGRRPIFIFATLVAVVGAMTIALATGPIMAIVGMVITATMLVGIRSAVLAMAVDRSGQRESTTLGFAFSVLDGFGALGAVAAGALGNIDLHYSFMLVAGLAALAALTALAAPLVQSTQPSVSGGE
jgi:FSR family fosmidomycin resistance protein-like MFS transporter